jgi:hypothetical protein
VSVRDDLLAAARTLLITVGGATDAKVIHAGAKGPRPEKPYVTVRLTTPGAAVGAAERLDSLDEDDAPVVAMRERREASLSIQGYGADSFAWLDALERGLDSPASLAAQADLGVSAVLLTPTDDISAMLDTAEETRFSLELTLRYRLTTTPAAAVELRSAVISTTATRYDDDPQPLTANQTVSLA